MYKSGLAIWYNVANLDRTLDFYTRGLGFEVEDIELAVAELKSRGVSFTERLRQYPSL